MSGTGRRAPETTAGWRRGRPLLVLVLLAAVGVAAGRLTVLVLHRWDAPAEMTTTAAADLPATVGAGPERPSVQGAVRAAEVLHEWDAGRAAAYARGDPASLRALYVSGSRAGTRDVRVLRAYAARGLVVRGLRTQVLSLEVRTATSRHLVLRVTDRRAGGRVVVQERTGAGVTLPQDAPSTHVVVLRRAGERWRVASVTDS